MGAPVVSGAWGTKVPVVALLTAALVGWHPVAAVAIPIPVLRRRAIAPPSSSARAGEEVPAPSADDRDRDRIRRLQETISEILRNRTLGRLRVGLRVVSARTGRLYYANKADSLMDPASNQKVLATTAALMRLGADWRFRTELSGSDPDADGVIHGNLFLRGNGDPVLRMRDLEAMAGRLRARGVLRVEGGVVADSRRLGEEGPIASGDSGGRAAPDVGPPLLVNHGFMVVRVRPGPAPGSAAVVSTEPPDHGAAGFVVRNQVVTKEGGRRARITVQVSMAGGRLRIDVAGRIGVSSAAIAFGRRVPQPALHAAALMRAALSSSGIEVRDAVSVGMRTAAPDFVETHRSAPLSIILRRINKDSDNDQAERVLQTVGAEERGGAATTEKGLSVLREVLGGMGLSPSTYLSKNGSGLGHANRITPHAMADLLRALYLDPRVGAEILQSLSVGGIDGTTRNRFKGTLAARRVRAKTGTLNGKSCLSGLVGDGDEVMVFSMMVQGFRGKSLPAVRAAQVGAVTAMMRYVREGAGERIDLPQGFDEQMVGRDVETGGEVVESPQAVEGETELDGKSGGDATPSRTGERDHRDPRSPDDADVMPLSDGPSPSHSAAPTPAPTPTPLSTIPPTRR